MRQKLIQLGFSEHEADVYLAMLEISQLTGAGEIVKRTGLHRNIVYETLDRLIAKKLLTKVLKKNIAQFQLTDPKRLLDYQKANLVLAKDLIPDLVNKASIKNDVVVWDGLEGYRNFSMNVILKIPEGTTLYVLGAVGDIWYEIMGDKLKDYFRIKKRKKIKWKLVSFVSSKLDHVYFSKSLDKIRYMPQEYQAPANVLIWKDHIALQTFVEPFSVIEIQNRLLAQAYYNYFNAMWELASRKVRK